MKIRSTILAVLISTAPVSTLWAQTYFTFDNYIEPSSVLEFGLITTDAPATLEVYDYAGGERGELLGTTELDFGANTDVTVNVAIPPQQDVLALIRNDAGEVIASEQFRLLDEEDDE